MIVKSIISQVSLGHCPARRPRSRAMATMPSGTCAPSFAPSLSRELRDRRRGGARHPRLGSFRGSPIAKSSPSPFQVAVPKRQTTDVDDAGAFRDLMERAGVKHRVRLASGTRGRGLFPSGPVGWGGSAVLLSVPLDVCIVAPFGDAETTIADELGFGNESSGSAGRGATETKDTYLILRTAWEKRNGVTLPGDITCLLDSKSGDDRELAIALWVLFATRTGSAKKSIWRAYQAWLPTPDEMPSLLLASDKELEQLQDVVLKKQAQGLHAEMHKIHKKAADLFAAGNDASDNAFTKSITLDDLRWAFALVASRGVASPIGGSASVFDAGGASNSPTSPPQFAAILTPFFDMANSDDVSLCTSVKSVRGTQDEDVRNAARIVLEKGLNNGVGGPRVVLETAKGLQNEDSEIVISYDPDAQNAELMLRYGFSLRGNRNERLPGMSSGELENGNVKNPIPKRCRPEVMRAALETAGVMTEDVDATERRRLICAVASACDGFGNPDDDDDDWELSVEEVEGEVAIAVEFRATWQKAVASFETSLAQDEAVLTAAKTNSLPGATPRVLAAIEYRAERKRVLETGINAMGTYIEWLEADEEEEDASGGFEDQE